MLTRTAEHALRALLYMVQQPQGALVPAGRIAEATGAPANYLAKTMNGLASAGLVRGTRGREGGYSLAVPANAITVGDVIAAFEATQTSSRCLLGDRSCSSEHPCGAHQKWQSAQRTAFKAVRSIRIVELAQDEAARQEQRPLRAAS